MSDHGMNCPHLADKDEMCTCALTERTMHAAWRKRAEEAEARIAALESQVKTLTAERDAQAEAVKRLAEYGGASHGVRGPFKCWDSRRFIDAFDAVLANQTASAAIWEAAKKDPRAAVEGGKA